MMPFKQLLCFVLGIFCMSIAHSQDNTVYQDNHAIAIPIVRNENSDANSRITNYFIDEIALSNQKKAEFTKFIFTGTQICRIVETQQGNFAASFELTDVTNTGDVNYKSFSIADMLIPSNCSFTFKVFGSQANPISVQSLLKLSVQKGYNKLADFSFTDTSQAKKFRIELLDLQFNYDSLAISRFSKRLKLIDDYFLSETWIQQYMNQVKSIDFSNTDMIIVYDIRLKDLEKASEELYNLDFAGKLQLGSHDPIQFIEKYNNFSDTLLLMRNQMNEKLSTLDRIYYDKGMLEIQRKETIKGEAYFKKSILFNPRYAPSQLELAKIQFRRDSLIDASNKIAYILQKLNPEPAVQKQVMLYADTVYTKMIAVGNEYVRTEKFNEAVELFEQCTKFCTDLPAYTCNETHKKGLASAKFGIYQSYLSVSQKALDNGKLELAEIYITAAQNYQKTNSNEIISDAGALLKFEKLVTAYVVKADTNNSKQQFEKALALLEKAQNVSTLNALPLSDKFKKSMAKAKNGTYRTKLKRSAKALKSNDADQAEALLTEAKAYQKQNADIVKLSSTADSLLSKIKGMQYTSAITKGVFNVYLQNYVTALSYFDNAKKLEQTYTFKTSPLLDSLIRATALPVILKQMDYAKSLLITNRIDSAKAMVPYIKNTQSHHQLASDSIINNRFDRLNRLIFKTECTNARISFDSASNQGTISANKQNYLRASELFTAAVKISERFPECNMHASNTINDKKMIQPAAEYQSLLQKAEFALAQQNLAEYFVHYFEAENFYVSNTIKNYGLIHHLLIDIVSISTNIDFVVAANELFIAKNHPDEALLCLKTLQKLQYPMANTKGIQQQLGTKMAMKDYAINPAMNPLITVTAYTANDKWFNYFKTAYCRSYKSLK